MNTSLVLKVKNHDSTIVYFCISASNDNKVCISVFLPAMTIKKKIQTKYRLPILNWTPLKPQQVKGTIFADLEDEKLYNVRFKFIKQFF